MASGPITSRQIDGETMETVTDFIFWSSKITADGHCSHKWKDASSLEKSYDKTRQHIKMQRHHFVDKGLYRQSYGFSSSHVWIWELDQKEGGAVKNWCFWTVVLEKTLESLLDRREIKSVNPKGSHSWIFIGRTNAEAEPPIRRPPDAKKSHWKTPWCWERLNAGGEGDNRGQDGWMASPIQWTWFWASSRRWWKTGKPGMLQSMGLQRVGHAWKTEQQ